MRKSLGIMVVLMLCLSAMAYGDTYTLGWPPPGGVSYNFSSPSNIGSANGMTIYFNNLNPSAYGSLYWGPNGIANIRDTLYDPNPTGYMAYLGYFGNGMYGWKSTIPLSLCGQTYGCGSTQTYLFAQVQSYDGFSNGWQPAGLGSTFSATLNGVNPVGGPEPVWGILGTSFQVHLQYMVGGYNGLPLDFWFNTLDSYCPNEQCLVSEFNGGFWASEAPQPGVPEPGSLVLLGTGLLGLGRLVRRRL